MKMKSPQRFILVGLVACLALLTAACQASPQRESKPSADWSRSVAVGDFATGSIGILVDDTGERVHLVWPGNMGKGTYLRYVQLNERAEPTVKVYLEFSGLLRAPRLAPAGENQLHLTWGSRIPGEKTWIIWHLLLDDSGTLLSSPRQISLPGHSVRSYQAVSDQQGGLLVCWENDDSGEIYLQRLDPAGEKLGETVRVTDRGASPAVWLDAQGNLTLAWQEAGNMVYARATLAALLPKETTVIGDIPQGTGRSVDGPYLGVAGGWVYVFWSVLNQSGLEAGTGFTVYTTFPADQPVNGEAERILLSPLEEPPYAAYQGSLQLTQLAPPEEQGWASTDFVLSPSVMQGSQEGELALALAMNQLMRMDQHLQIAVLVFKDGRMLGYSLGTKTANISDEPVLYIDQANHLHLAWREGPAGNSIYYATTQPEAQAALDRLTAGDLIDAVFQGGMEGLVGATFLPIIGFGWLLPGMILLVVVKIFRDQDNLTEWKYWVPLVVAILMYYLIKLATLPTISSYVPFSAWLDIPASIGLPLRVAVPVLILVFATLAADWVRRHKTPSAIMFYITFVLVDALLSLVIYGVNLLGVY